MTDKRDLKRLVRERQAKTGESYVTARAQVLAQRPKGKKEPAFPVVEMVDVTSTAEKLELKCQAAMTSTLAARFQPDAVLDKLRTILSKTLEDAQLERMRKLVFEGEDTDSGQTNAATWRANLRQFVARANAGIGGVSSCGSLLAFPVDSGLVIAHAGVPVALGESGQPHAQLLLSGGDDQIVWSDLLVAALRFKK